MSVIYQNTELKRTLGQNVWLLLKLVWIEEEREIDIVSFFFSFLETG